MITELPTIIENPGNVHWKEKVRQILQMLERAGLAIHHGYGKWSVD